MICLPLHFLEYEIHLLGGDIRGEKQKNTSPENNAVTKMWTMMSGMHASLLSQLCSWGNFNR
jgi:hypothetical protein